MNLEPGDRVTVTPTNDEAPWTGTVAREHMRGTCTIVRRDDGNQEFDVLDSIITLEA